MNARSIVAAALAALASVALAQGHAQHQQHQTSAAEVKPSTVKVRYDDSQLLDYDAKPVKLKSDVIGDRIVVLDFVYTSCTTVCPVLSALMAQVQGSLDAKAAEEVRLVTISVDPARDSPQKMKEYAGRYGAKPGWVWLTGPTGRVNEVLKGFGAYAPNFEDHPPLVLVGDARTGQWVRYFGLNDPKLVIAKVQELRAARNPDAHAGHAAHKH